MMLFRPILLAALLIAGQLMVVYIEKGYTLGSVTPPARELTELPMQLGFWSGTDQPVDERIRQFLRARSGVDRTYRGTLGESVTAHIVWTDEYLRMHFPQQCYRESGWDETRSEDVLVKCENGDSVETAGEDIEITTAKADSFPAKLLTFEQDNRQIKVLYWFQMGDQFFFDRVRHRTLRREVCWGHREWPPLVKVMLQSSGPRSEDNLRDLAGRVYSWMQAM